MSHKQRVFVPVLMLVAALSAGILALAVSPRPAASPPATTVKVTVPRSTTTTDPYANLRASLDDYCAAIGRGHAFIIVKNGAPEGDCTG